MGLLARAYIQGAGQGLSEDGVSYWQRAADVAGSFIADTEAGGGTYGGYLYKDVSDMWAVAITVLIRRHFLLQQVVMPVIMMHGIIRTMGTISYLHTLTGIRQIYQIFVR